jgi:hypothetical protein
MRIALQCLSWTGLALTIVPSAVFLAGRMELDTVKWLMLIGMLLWFAATPFWMERKG